MKKRVIFIIFTILLLISYLVVSGIYKNDITNIKIEKKINDKTFVDKYSSEFLMLLLNGKYDDAYEKFDNVKYSNISEFKNYIDKNVIFPGFLKTIESITEISKDKYEIKAKLVYPPYPSDELIKSNFVDKKITLELVLNGVFDYKITNIE